MAEKLTDSELKAIIANELRAAITYAESELASDRARAIEYYRGEMNDVASLPGRSSFTSRDVSDTIGWMLPGIIRVFSASDRMGVYEPERPGDEAFCEQATDYANFIFWRDNDGYRILWDATHDSLLHGNGIVKHYWDDQGECEYSEHTGLTDEQIAILVAQGGEDVEIVGQRQGKPQTVMVDDGQGGQAEQQIITFDVKLKRVRTYGRVRVECIAPEDFVLDADAVRTEEARFVAHRRQVTRSDLIEMGFERDLVEGLPTENLSSVAVEEKIARDESYGFALDTAHDSMQIVELFECYIRIDADDDGIAETVRAYYAGANGAGELLDWEVWEDDLPFTDIPCTPIPHRWEAGSVFDETEDLQRVKTVLTRQILDNLYASNMPMLAIKAEAVTNPEALAAPQFGQTIEIDKKFALADAIQPLAVPFVADKALNAVQYFDMVREMRTGVSRSTMALDPEALTNQTATAVQAQKDAAYSQVELIARNQAELGWRKVFKALLRLIVKHQDRPRMIRLRDEWVEMDPRHWNAEMDVQINVGLGTGSRERDMAMLGQILMIQREMVAGLVQTGMPDMALRMSPKLVESARKITEAAGIRHPDQFWPDLDENEIEQIIQQKAQQGQQPDPKMIEAQARTEIEKAKLQADMQAQQAKFQFEIQLKQAELQMEREREQMRLAAEAEARKIDAELRRMQIVEEMALKREQLGAELALKREVSFAEIEMKREIGVATASAKASTSTSGVHVGGEPG